MDTRVAACYSSPIATLARTLGDNLRFIRTRLGITQVEASRRANVPQNTLSAWERGASFRQFEAIEEVLTRLGVDPLELLHPARPELDEVAALYDAADSTTREIVLSILRLRAGQGARAVG